MYVTLAQYYRMCCTFFAKVYLNYALYLSTTSYMPQWQLENCSVSWTLGLLFFNLILRKQKTQREDVFPGSWRGRKPLGPLAASGSCEGLTVVIQSTSLILCKFFPKKKKLGAASFPSRLCECGACFYLSGKKRQSCHSRCFLCSGRLFSIESFTQGYPTSCANWLGTHFALLASLSQSVVLVGKKIISETYNIFVGFFKSF